MAPRKTKEYNKVSSTDDDDDDHHHQQQQDENDDDDNDDNRGDDPVVETHRDDDGLHPDHGEGENGVEKGDKKYVTSLSVGSSQSNNKDPLSSSSPSPSSAAAEEVAAEEVKQLVQKIGGRKLTTTTKHVGEDHNDETLQITVDEAIERLGFGKFQCYVLVAAGFCFAADAMQVLLFSFLGEVLKELWNLTKDETASIGSILFAGAMLGTLILGPLADQYGRHPVFMIASSIIATFGISVSFVTSYWNLLPVVFMIGAGVGGLTVPFDILAEFLPAASRGKNLLLIEYFWTIGTLYVVVMAYLTLGGADGIENGNNSTTTTEGDNNDDIESHLNWRLFSMLASLPCTVSILLGWFLVPESPRWLCTQGRCDEALDIIRKAAVINGVDVDLVFPRGMTLQPEDVEEANFMELFAPQWRPTIFKLWGLWAAMAFGYYGIVMATTRIFASEETANRNNLNNHDSSPTIPDDYGTTTTTDIPTFDYGAIFVSSSAELIGITIVVALVDIAGRIPLQVVSFAIAGVCLFTLCYLAAHGASRQVLIAFGFLNRIFEMAASCVTWVSTAELLPTEIRTTGHSTANAIARIAAILCPFLVEDSPLVVMGSVMLGIHVFAVLCVSQLPETKGSHMGTTNANPADGHTSQAIDDEGREDVGLSSAINAAEESERMII